jgi:hypothetical protein
MLVSLYFSPLYLMSVVTLLRQGYPGFGPQIGFVIEVIVFS